MISRPRALSSILATLGRYSPGPSALKSRRFLDATSNLYLLSIRIDLAPVSNCVVCMTVSSMCILRLWNIQLTLDWVGIEPHDAHPRKSELNCCKCIQELLRSDIFCRSYWILNQHSQCQWTIVKSSHTA